VPKKTIRRDGLPLLVPDTGQTTKPEQPPAIASFPVVHPTLEEGPQTATQLVGCESGSVSVGPAVRVESGAAGERLGVPRFVPA